KLAEGQEEVMQLAAEVREQLSHDLVAIMRIADERFDLTVLVGPLRHIEGHCFLLVVAAWLLRTRGSILPRRPVVARLLSYRLPWGNGRGGVKTRICLAASPRAESGRKMKSAGSGPAPRLIPATWQRSRRPLPRQVRHPDGQARLHDDAAGIE